MQSPEPFELWAEDLYAVGDVVFAEKVAAGAAPFSAQRQKALIQQMLQEGLPTHPDDFMG